MPAIVLQIIEYIRLAIAAAPLAKELYTKGKAIIDQWFNAGVITIAQQAQLHAHLDAVQAAALAGQIPPEFTVEADPQ